MAEFVMCCLCGWDNLPVFTVFSVSTGEIWSSGEERRGLLFPAPWKSAVVAAALARWKAAGCVLSS